MIESQIAGGIVIGPNKKVIIVNQNGNSWSLPKGHLDKGENYLQAAVREIEEETGVKQLDFIEELGSYQRYKIGLEADEDKSELKNIKIFLFTTNETVLKPQDPDNPEARWVEPDKINEYLTHQKDKQFIELILPQVKKFIAA